MNQSLQLENLKANGSLLFSTLKSFLEFNLKHFLYYFEDFNTTFLKSPVIDEEPTNKD